MRYWHSRRLRHGAYLGNDGFGGRQTRGVDQVGGALRETDTHLSFYASSVTVDLAQVLGDSLKIPDRS
jgi:hypothetical protein